MITKIIKLFMWLSGFYLPHFHDLNRGVSKVKSRAGKCQLILLKFVSIAWCMLVNAACITLILYNIQLMDPQNDEFLVMAEKVWALLPLLGSSITSAFFYIRRAKWRWILSAMDRMIITPEKEGSSFTCTRAAIQHVLLGILFFGSFYFTSVELVSRELLFLHIVLFHVEICYEGIVYMVTGFTFSVLVEVCTAKCELLAKNWSTDAITRYRYFPHRLGVWEINSEIKNKLFGLEKSLLEVRQFLDVLMEVFQWPLVVANLMAIVNGVIGLFLVLDSLVNQGTMGVRFWYSTSILIWSAFLLFIGHSAADRFNKAKQALANSVRRFLLFQRHSSCLSLQVVAEAAQPYRFSVAEFFSLGRSSITNTMAFVLSYVFVALQFRPAQNQPTVHE
ncbi:Gustatory receptor 152 [Hyalella azteca]|uniref:Gustatory receptor 152 n=1 Tax=Hyalella azteca TaxID=294128 RepID=A0A6A0GUT9_HYAAZ|nr:Gustatory receptor 152 [Hyalella azteca]